VPVRGADLSDLTITGLEVTTRNKPMEWR
jgi:hypothetical protein